MSTIDRLNKLSPEQRAQLVQVLRSEKKTPVPPIPRRGVFSPVPVSSSQERLWFMEQFNPGEPTYNIPGAFQLRGSLDVAALQKSVDAVIQRHEVLRTTFSSVNGQPVQVIAPASSLTMPVYDLQGLAPTEQNTELRRLMTTHFCRSFDLTLGPLIRISLVRLSDQDTMLLLSMHHIISDGWSVSIFVRELSHAYASFVAGEIPVFSDGLIQYADFAVWQRDALAGDKLDKSIAYWKTQFANAAPVLEMPTDKPRPPIQAFEGAKKFIFLPQALLDSLKRVGQQEEATLFMVLFAAFNTLLHRYSHQEDIVVGTPAANRGRVELEQTIGFFVSTLALRTDLSGNPTFRDLLRRVRKVALDAYAHQDLPFEKLVEVLQPPRDLSRPPLFQALFSLQNTPSSELKLPALTVSSVDAYIPSAKFDISMYVAEENDHLAVVLEYRTDLFEDDTIDRMLEHFRNLLTSVAADPNTRIGELELMTEVERRQLLFAWNNTQREFPAPGCVHQLFEIQVRRRPEATAVVCGDQRISYRELNENANRLARYLRDVGVDRGVLVGICLERSIDMCAALLGVLKAGGAYVPLDPGYPKERLAFMLEDAQVKILLTQADIAGMLPSGTYESVLVQKIGEGLTDYSGDDLGVSVTDVDPAYVIYTSGSTGKPKGVRILHRGLFNFLSSMREEPGLNEDDIWLAVTTLSFDIAGAEIYLPLVTGAQVVLATREDTSDGPRLERLLTSSGATVMQATPATWQLLLQTSWRGSDRLKILCGGEAFPWALAEQLIQRSASLWNMYGPTETTIWSALGRIEAGAGKVLLTRPLANTRIYLLDPATLKPVPLGIVGEVFIGGDGLARDYMNRPELTAHSFIKDPFSARPEERLYRTGDVARRFKDGRIEILGRVDHQVKIRGFRIELGEIEAVLAELPDLRESVVTAVQDESGDKRLVAYVVPAREPAPTTAELRAHLKNRLPDYMVPSVFVFLKALPLTANGKVDRRALPAPDQSRPALESHFVPPETAVEKLVAGIWCTVLRLERVGIHDNFFDLGGHSLLATRVIASLQANEIDIPVRTLFERPTIAEFCKAVALAGEKKSTAAAPALVPISRESRKTKRSSI